MSAMNGFDIFEKMTGVSDKFIEEAAEMPNPEAKVIKTSRSERFSRFINGPVGVAMICGVVAVGVIVGIVAAGRAAGSPTPVNPSAGTSGQTQHASTDTERFYDETVPPVDPVTAVDIGGRTVSLTFRESVSVSRPTGNVTEDIYVDENGTEYVFFGGTAVLKRFTDISLQASDAPTVSEAEVREAVDQVLARHAWPMLYGCSRRVEPDGEAFVCHIINEAAEYVSGIGEDSLSIRLNGSGVIYSYDYTSSNLMELCVRRSTPATFAEAYARMEEGDTGVYYSVRDGILCFVSERIQYITSTETDASGEQMGGCGIDHEHIFCVEKLMSLAVSNHTETYDRTLTVGNLRISYTLSPEAEQYGAGEEILITVTVENIGEAFTYTEKGRMIHASLERHNARGSSVSMSVSSVGDVPTNDNGVYTVVQGSTDTVNFTYGFSSVRADKLEDGYYDLEISAYGVEVLFKDAIYYQNTES